MHIYKYLSFALLFWTSPAFSEISIRSGEHANFTRLVIYGHPQSAPTLHETDTGYRFSSGNHSDSFDLSKVFDKIPRSRIKNIFMPAKGLLDISVDCECYSKTEQLSDGRFVIDIVSGSQLQTTASLTPPPTPKAIQRDVSAQSARRGLPIVVSGSTDHETNTAEVNSEDAPTTKESALPTQQFDQKELLNQLSRAASQGLFTIEPEIARPTRPIAVAPAKPLVSPRHQLTIQTSFDRDTNKQISLSPLLNSGQSCTPKGTFSIGNWSATSNGSLRFPNYPVPIEGSQGSNGFKDSTSLKNFFKHQLYLTLGAEALALLQDPNLNFEGKPILILMAEIMEYEETSAYKQMTEFLSCEGPTALWAALSQPRLPRNVDVNTDAVISEFSALPKHLRTHLGPLLMRKFLSIGDTASATTVNEIVARGGLPEDSSNTLARAKLSLAQTDFSSAERDLDTVAHADDQNSVEATITLVENHIQRNEGISTQVIENIDALATLHKATTDGRRLQIAAIRARAHTAHFKEAIKHLQLIEGFPQTGNADHNTVIDELGKSLTDLASDGVFLRHIFGHNFWAAATEKTRIDIARRLLDLGFTENAKTMLKLNTSPLGRGARTLMAEAALEQGKPRQALSYISGLETNEAKEIRRHALELQTIKTSQSSSQDTVTRTPLSDHSPLPGLEELQDMLTQIEKSRRALEQKLNTTPTF